MSHEHHKETVAICRQANEDMHNIIHAWADGEPYDTETGISFLVNCKVCETMRMKEFWNDYNREVYDAQYPHDSGYSSAEVLYDEAIIVHDEELKRVPTPTTGELMAWVAAMENQDGTKGAHWALAQTTAVGEQHGFDFTKNSKECLYVWLNKMYSDHYNAAKRYNAHTTPDFYLALVMDDANDTDAVPLAERIAVYYNCIAK